MSRDLRHFAEILDTLDAIVWEADANTFVFTYVNDAAGRILGYPPSDWVGREGFWESLIHSDDRDETVRFCTDAVRAAKDHEFEYRAVAADGRTVWMHDVVRVVVDDGGSPVLLRGVMTDITDRKQAEEQRALDVANLSLTQQQLAESEERYRTLSELTSDYAWSVRFEESGESRFEWMSAGFERVTGYKVETFENEGWRPLIHPDDIAVTDDALALLAKGQPMDVELRLIRPSGRIVWIHAVARPIMDASGRLERILGSARDITERKVAEEERERLQHQLLQSQKMEAIGRLAGGVAHDFNNILGAILNYATFIKENPDDPETVASDAAEIVKAGTRAAALTRQLLMFSRRETAQLESLDLCQVVMDYGRFLERTLGENIELRLELSARAAPVLADRLHIEQILLNLAVNSRDAMPQGGVLTITIQPEGSSEVRLTVADTGIGMDPDVTERAFEPFFTTKPSGQGTGLGLATVYGIAETLGGHARLEGAPGIGTSVHVILPLAPEGEELGEGTGDSAASPRRAMRLLVVEDEDQLRTLITRMLKADGHEVLPAATADEALELGSGVIDSLDLVITDVVMPGMSGIELGRALRKARSDLPILFMSGYPADVIEAQGGIDDALLEKPFSQADLRAAIARETEIG